MLNLICEETNKFFKFVSETYNFAKNPKSRLTGWKDLTVNELMQFFALTLLMPHVKKLSIELFWTKCSLRQTPIFGEVMARDRYTSILAMLHFSDNRQPVGRLKKLQAILEPLRKAFKNAYTPGRNLCIDESLLLFKGRLLFKQYIPSKRSRFGIKTFVLCDCETGYILDFIIYTGSETEAEKIGDLGKAGDIVISLLSIFCRF